jgi:NAD dependent epimerase/dehydratase family
MAAIDSVQPVTHFDDASTRVVLLTRGCLTRLKGGYARETVVGADRFDRMERALFLFRLNQGERRHDNSNALSCRSRPMSRRGPPKGSLGLIIAASVRRGVYVITGGAGFIGSNIAAALDQQGADIVISDWMGANDFKWRNIAKRRQFDIVPLDATGSFLCANREKIAGVFHMRAISTTIETDIDAIVRNNIRLSIDLWNWCLAGKIPLVYASSAATYGDGREGSLDRCDPDYLARLRPLNAYGWSKALFDRWVEASISCGWQVTRRRPHASKTA